MITLRVFAPVSANVTDFVPILKSVSSVAVPDNTSTSNVVSDTGK